MYQKRFLFFSTVLSVLLTQAIYADVTRVVLYRCPNINEITYTANGKPQADTIIHGVAVRRKISQSQA